RTEEIKFFWQQPLVEKEHLIWRFDIIDFDKLGLLVNRIEVKARAPALFPLARQAELLADRLRYLEDFKLIEYDNHNDTVLLRSRVPQRLGDVVRYYEIVLRGGSELSFGRYEFDPVTGREAIAANLARETFERLLVDLEGLFSQSTDT